MVQWIQVDVAQQRTEHRALRRAGLGSPGGQTVQDAGFQERFEQRQQAAVGNPFSQASHQTVVRDRVEVTLEVGVYDVDVSGLEQSIHPSQRIFTTASGP